MHMGIIHQKNIIAMRKMERGFDVVKATNGGGAQTVHIGERRGFRLLLRYLHDGAREAEKKEAEIGAVPRWFSPETARTAVVNEEARAWKHVTVGMGVAIGTGIALFAGGLRAIADATGIHQAIAGLIGFGIAAYLEVTGLGIMAKIGRTKRVLRELLQLDKNHE